MGGDLASGIGLEIAAAFPGEAVEAAVEGPERRLELLEARQRHSGAAQIVRPRPLLRKAEQRPRLVIPALQLLPGERPARMRHIGAGFQVDRVELGATSAPDGGGAAEEAKPRILELVIVLARSLAGVEAGRPRLVIQPAALEQHDPVPE